MIKWADVIHLTAVYSPPTIPTLLICKELKKPVIWSPRGALQRWDGTTRKAPKKIWETICNLLCDSPRVLLHVTSEEERLDSLKRIKEIEAVVIPNGVDINTINTSRRWKPEDKLRLIYFGRLHPIKGIENLLHALARLDNDVSLAIYGDEDRAYQKSLAYRKSLESLTNELSIKGRVQFHGWVNGEGKSSYFQEADVCIVPSFRENFCMVVVESLAQGVPVIVSKGAPWKQIEDVGCGLWVDNNPENLAHAIKRISHMPLPEMGLKGREWMVKEFSWTSIAAKMLGVYQELVVKSK